MKQSYRLFSIIAFIIIIPFVCLGASWLYTIIQLQVAARSTGIYASPEEGMRALITKNYLEPYQYQIVQASPNAFDGSNPHVWYVIACVWGDYRVGGSRVGNEHHNYDQPGAYFLNTKDGWVFIGEGILPEFVGYSMKFFNLAGDGLAEPIYKPDTYSQGRCIRR